MADKERVFVLVKCNKGCSTTLGVVLADSPKKAAEKLNVEILGHLTKYDGLNAYYVKQEDKEEPQYILEEWKILKEFPTAISTPDTEKLGETTLERTKEFKVNIIKIEEIGNFKLIIDAYDKAKELLEENRITAVNFSSHANWENNKHNICSIIPIKNKDDLRIGYYNFINKGGFKFLTQQVL